MATTVQRFYPTTTDQDQAWGTDIRKLDDANGSLVSTTINQHPNAEGTTTITADPYASRSTQGDNRDVFGWAINESGADGMESTATEKRVIPSGTWTFQNRIAIPAGGTATGSHNVTLSWRVYRVAADTTRATLFTVTSDEISGGLLGSTQTFTTTSSQSEIILQADETLHVGLTTQDRQVAGALGATTAGNLTIHTGTENSVDIFVEVPSPGVRTKYLKSQDARLAGVDTVIRAVKLPLPVARLDGNPEHNRDLTLFRAFSTVMLGIDSLDRRISAFRAFSTAARGVATQVKKVLKPLTVVLLAPATTVKSVKKPFTVVLLGADAQFKKKVFGPGSFSVTLRGVAVFSRALTIRRAMFSALTGRGRGLTTFDFANVPGDEAPAVNYHTLTVAANGRAEMSFRLRFVRQAQNTVAKCHATMSFVASLSTGGSSPAEFLYRAVRGVVSLDRVLTLHRAVQATGLGRASMSYRKITNLAPDPLTYITFGDLELKWDIDSPELKWEVSLWDTVAE